MRSPADRVVDSCIQCGEDRQKVAFGSSFGLHFTVDFLTVVCASTIPTWALELGLLMVVAVICVAVYKLAYVSSTEKKADRDKTSDKKEWI